MFSVCCLWCVVVVVVLSWSLSLWRYLWRSLYQSRAAISPRQSSGWLEGSEDGPFQSIWANLTCEDWAQVGQDRQDIARFLQKGRNMWSFRGDPQSFLFRCLNENAHQFTSTTEPPTTVVIGWSKPLVDDSGWRFCILTLPCSKKRV